MRYNIFLHAGGSKQEEKHFSPFDPIMCCLPEGIHPNVLLREATLFFGFCLRIPPAQGLTYGYVGLGLAAKTNWYRLWLTARVFLLPTAWDVLS